MVDISRDWEVVPEQGTLGSLVTSMSLVETQPHRARVPRVKWQPGISLCSCRVPFEPIHSPLPHVHFHRLRSRHQDGGITPCPPLTGTPTITLSIQRTSRTILGRKMLSPARLSVLRSLLSLSACDSTRARGLLRSWQHQTGSCSQPWCVFLPRIAECAACSNPPRSTDRIRTSKRVLHSRLAAIPSAPTYAAFEAYSSQRRSTDSVPTSGTSTSKPIFAIYNRSASWPRACPRRPQANGRDSPHISRCCGILRHCYLSKYRLYCSTLRSLHTEEQGSCAVFFWALQFSVAHMGWFLQSRVAFPSEQPGTGTLKTHTATVATSGG